MALIAILTVLQAGAATAGTDQATVKKIIEQGRNGSEAMKNVEHLTDMIGPRLTGSKRFKLAADWAAQRMRDYKLERVHLEPFEFGRGWERGIAYGRMVAPYEMQLDFRSFAWTPGTDGRVTSHAVVLDANTPEALEKIRAKLKGGVVLWGAPAKVDPELSPRTGRMSDKEFKEDETSWPNQATQQASPPSHEEAKRRAEEYKFQLRILHIARQEGATAFVTDAGRPHGLLNATGYLPGTEKNEPEVPPLVTMTHEHYGMLYRLIKRGVDVRVEAEIKNVFGEDDKSACNVIGEIRGAERPDDEVVILGAHLDSWDLGTGATDNAAGAAAVLEAARILSITGIKPRRTIRFILFGGEEQGLVGSSAYVESHKDELKTISGVFVLDTGTGRIRGIGAQGNKEVIVTLKEILSPLSEVGAQYANDRSQPGTDHVPFDRAGVPAFAFFQDAIEYRERTHHSQTDTFDKILPDDLKDCAITMAVVAYSVAELPRRLPRKVQPGPGVIEYSKKEVKNYE